ncbi:uncharacterized protein LOC109423989 [Aedes albopictus]|uniref:BZIP domain-containing protein n=1 Tax=Aedes albopictus TaxID=7160 RepID=A0ABM1YGB4_AEDAL
MYLMDHDYCKVPNNDDFTDVEYLVEEFENVKPYLPTALRSTTGTQTDAEVKDSAARRCDCARKRARMEKESKRLRRLLALERAKCRMLKAKLRKLREELRILRAIKKRQEARKVAAVKRFFRKILYFGNHSF